MTVDVLKAYVERADADSIRVRIMDNALVPFLRASGFVNGAEQGLYLLPIADDKHKARVFDELRSLEVAFSAGKEWSPSEVFERLRDEQLLSGEFLRVSWTQPGQYLLVKA